MLDSVLDRAEELGLELKPRIIMIDFEAAAIKIFKKKFPFATIKGCFFHFTKAIFELNFDYLYKCFNFITNFD